MPTATHLGPQWHSMVVVPVDTRLRCLPLQRIFIMNEEIRQLNTQKTTIV